MKTLNEYPFDELPIVEIIDAVSKQYADLNIDIDDLKEKIRSHGKNSVEITVKKIRIQSEAGLVRFPLPYSDEPQNMKEIDDESFNHMGMIWETIKEVALNTQAPGEMIVMSTLAACSTVAQGIYDVRSPLGTTHPLSTNSIVIAESGERKTTVDNVLSQAFSTFTNIVNEEISCKNNSFHGRLEAWKAIKKILASNYKSALKEGEGAWERREFEEHETKKPILIPNVAIKHSDFTISALLENLFGNSPVACISSSEGAKVLNDVNMSHITPLNLLWDGNPVNVIRSTKSSIYLNNARLTTALMIQPDVLSKILKKGNGVMRSSGYLSRALICCPKSNIGNRKVYATEKSQEKVDAFHTRITEMLIELMLALFQKNFTRKELELDNEAERMWLNFSNEVEDKMRPGCMYSEATDYASKLAENVLRTAGALHAVEFGDGKISAQTLNAAIRICDRCSKDFIRMFVPRAQNEVNGERLYKYLKENYANYLFNRTPEQIYFHERFIKRNRVLQCGPLANAEELNQALSWLIGQRQILVVEEIRPKGKGTVYIDLMPNYTLPHHSIDFHPLRIANIN